MTASPIREALDHAAKTFREYARLHAAKPDMVKANRNTEHAQICEKALAHLDAIENAPANNGRSLMTEVLNLVEMCCNCLELSGNDDLKRRVTEFLSAAQPSTESVVNIEVAATAISCQSTYMPQHGLNVLMGDDQFRNAARACAEVWGLEWR